MAPTTSTAPLFPTFLLPSFSLPFRRRRSSPSSHLRWASARSSVGSEHSPVPSLSSSPTDTFSDSEPASPSDLDALAFPVDWAEDECASPVSKAGPISLHRPQPDTLRCGTCASDIAFGAQIVSKGFTGRYGRAFLVGPPSTLSTTPSDLGLDTRPYGISRRDVDERDDTELLNIKIGRRENRQLVTGAHVVADISCAVCGTKVGWKYVEATEAAQKYKEGKFILETQRVVAFRSWEDGEHTSGLDGRGSVVYPREWRMSSLRRSLDTDDHDKADDVQASEVYDVHHDQVVVFDSEDEDECDDIFAGTWDPSVVVKRRERKSRGKKAQGT